ncbi:MAG: sigma-70 family RNA polymerase sigma factor [Flavobacteriales bacterium]|nr:sigma-70 family RNA polymerase sigma factor [Flavobacteriales bacterium]
MTSHPNGHSNSPDLELIEALTRNDEQAVRTLYTRHYPAVEQYVLQNNGERSDAKDLFQEALIVLWTNLKDGRLRPTAETNPGAYLYRICKNKWLDHLRSAAYNHRSNMRIEHVERVDDGSAEIEERIDHLQSIYAQLDDRCKKVLDLFYYEKKDLETISTMMGVDVGSIRTIKYRCMMKLRKYHEGIDNSGSDAVRQ